MNLKRINHLYDESIKNIERVNNLYKINQLAISIFIRQSNSPETTLILNLQCIYCITILNVSSEGSEGFRRCACYEIIATIIPANLTHYLQMYFYLKLGKIPIIEKLRFLFPHTEQNNVVTMQLWDGFRPKANSLQYHFYIYLADRKPHD